MKKILITAFEPFGKDKINPSEEILKKIKSKYNKNKIYKLLLPVTFNESFNLLKKEIIKIKPDIIISLGLAGGRDNISIERIAINIDDAKIPDNNGYQPIDKQICSNGKNAYFSNLPLKKIVDEINKIGIKASVSNTAGTYVCNHIMYQVLNYINKNNLKIKGGFIHIPYAKEFYQENLYSMKINDILLGIEKAIEISINYEKDEKLIGGKIH